MGKERKSINAYTGRFPPDVEDFEKNHFHGEMLQFGFHLCGRKRMSQMLTAILDSGTGPDLIREDVLQTCSICHMRKFQTSL